MALTVQRGRHGVMTAPTESTPPVRPASAQMDASRRGLITVSIMLASVLQSLDNTIATVALPHIQGSLSATQDQISWVLTSYIVGTAIMTPLSGWLASRVGRRRVFLASIAGFVVASMLCGLAQSLSQIVLSRLLQGICGAALLPMSQAVLLDINPPERYARAMSVWAMGTILGPIIGPALGGWLTENYNWRWVFYINVPLGILAFVGVAGAMSETVHVKSRFDFFGFVSLSMAVGALQLMLDRGQLNDWFSSSEIWIEATVGASALYLFVVHVVTSTKPLFITPAPFKDRNFLAGNVLVFVMGAVLFATLALLPPLLQELLNYPVMTAGVVTAPRGVGTLLSMFVAGRLVGTIDTRILIGVGFALTALSLKQMSGFDLQMGQATIVWSGLAQGVGIGFVFVALSTATFANLPPTLRNEGTTFFSLMRNLGSSIGISVVTTLWTRNTQVMHSILADHVNPYNAVLRAQFGGPLTIHTLAGLDATVTAQARMIAYNNDFTWMMGLCLAAIPLVLLLRKGANRGAAPEQTLAME